MDCYPFRFLESVAYDVYMLYDYRHFTNLPEIEALFKKYDRVHLVSWSMGVWAGQKLFAKCRHFFSRTIAINGTLCPVDNRFGIPLEVFKATLADFSEGARLKFYKRMCRNKVNLQRFMANQPQRSVKDQEEELAVLKKMVDCTPATESMYREIIVSEKDFIVPSASQLLYWQGALDGQEGRVTSVAGFHFLFHRWSSWDQLLNYSGNVPKC